MKNSSNKKAKDRVCRVFSEVQAGNYLPSQAVAAFQLVQEENGKSEGTAKGTKSFSSGMELGLKHCLNLYLTSDTSTAKDMLMETFVEFALVSTGPKPPKQSVCCWPNHSYAVSVLKHILDNTTRSSDKGVRTRSCQMVAQLLKVSSYPEEYFAKE